MKEFTPKDRRGRKDSQELNQHRNKQNIWTRNMNHGKNTSLSWKKHRILFFGDKKIKFSQDEIKSAITKMQSQMDAKTPRMNEAEQWIHYLENKIMEHNEAGKKRETKANDHDTWLRKLGDLLKRNNSWVIGVQEDEEREKRAEVLCAQIITENFPNLGNDTDIKIQGAQGTPNRFNKSWPSPRHIIVKFTKYMHKERVTKAAGGKGKSP